MNPKSFLVRLASGAAWLAACGAIIASLAAGYWPDAADSYRLVLAFGIVALGELLEVDLKGGRSTPVSNALVFALFVILDPPVEVVIAVVPAFFVAFVLRAQQLGWGPRFRSTSRRLATTFIALVVYVALDSALPALGVSRGELLSRTIAMIVSGIGYFVVDTAASAAFVARSQGVPFRPVWKGQVQSMAALHAAFLSVSALMALAFDVLREWAFALFLLPLFATRYSFRRYSSIHKTYTQTIRALSTLPELAGYAPPGHSIRVAELATAIARQYGMTDSEVQEVEFAALLHDVGLLSFADPGGAQPASLNDEKLARASAAILEQTPYLERVARLVRDRDLPYRSGRLQHVGMLGSRIVRVADDLVELTEEGGPALSTKDALEQIRAFSGTTYDPSVVSALERALDQSEA